jgi:F420-0:gamma-glutamyl ligase
MIIKNKNKKGQADVIVTVLLILLGIVAVAVVSAFVINLVRNNLRGTECFDTADKLAIKLGDYTYFDSDSKNASVSIERAETSVNISGLIITLSNGADSKAFTIKAGSVDNVAMYDDSPDIILPKNSEIKTYKITTEIENVNHVKIVPIILTDSGERACKEGTAEADIPIKSSSE